MEGKLTLAKSKKIYEKWQYLTKNSKDLSLDSFYGLEFPGGEFFIDKKSNLLVNNSTGNKLSGENINRIIQAHPIYFMIITLRGSGASIQDIFDLLNYDTKNGPMLGQCNMTFNTQLKVDCKYFVKGQINSLIKKNSKKLGEIKILDFSLTLLDVDSKNVGNVNYVWILPLGKNNEI